jgi:hypothetical protein
MTILSKEEKWIGIDNHYLILEADDFIVFLDSDLDVDWLTSDKYDGTGPRDPVMQNEILNYAASLECIPNSHHKRNVRLNFKRMVGEGVARSLDHDYKSAEDILRSARDYINDRNIEAARFWQLSTACLLGILLAAVGLLLWIARVSLISAFGDPVYFLLLAGAAGSLGSVLSMAFRMGHTFPTSESPKALHILEAASKVFAGCLSGLLVGGCVEAGLLLPILGQSGRLHAGMIIFATVSGASERLVPSLIAKIEKNEDSGSSKGGDLA